MKNDKWRKRATIIQGFQLRKPRIVAVDSQIIFMDDNKAIILNSYSMKWYIPERLPRCLRMIGWHESQALGCQELRQKVFLCLPSHTAHSQDTFKGTLSLFLPRGPEIALTFLRNEFIVKLWNSQMGPSNGKW